MKIVFVCGALEPGKDGVGDYVLRLADELIRQGHNVAIMAINDRFVIRPKSGHLNSDNIQIPVIRLPEILSKKQRAIYAQKWVGAFKPDWVSLQFVPFSYHRKGLTIGLSSFMVKIFGNCKWHIMFHELWVGMAQDAPKKTIAWGWLQRQIIKSLITNLKPQAIHTQTKLHVAMLANDGFKANYLPLFGNIPAPVFAVNNYSAIRTAVLNNNITLLHFGTIYPHAPIEQFLAEAALYAKANNIKITLDILGRCGNEKARWKKACEQTGIAINILGMQPSSQVSKYFLNASIGITTTAFQLVEKSGSVAAMQEHGLPIICVSKNWQPRGGLQVTPRTNVFEYSAGNFKDCIAVTPNSLYTTNVGETSQLLLAALLDKDKKKSIA